MHPENKFVIVEFEDGLQIVSSQWIDETDETKCWWPVHLTSKVNIQRAIINHTKPVQSGNWIKYNIKKLLATATTWEKALDEVSHAEDTSHLENTEFLDESQKKEKAEYFKKRRRARAKKIISSTDEIGSDEERAVKKKKTCYQYNRFSVPDNRNRSSIRTIGSPPFITSLRSRNVETNQLDASTTLRLRSDKGVIKNRNYITTIADVHEDSRCRSSSKVGTFSPCTESQNMSGNESDVSTVAAPQNEDHVLSHVTDEIANDRGYPPMFHSTSIESEHLQKQNAVEKKSSSGMEKIVLKHLVTISYRLQSFENSLKDLHSKQRISSVNDIENDLEEDCELPLKTIDELEEFEKRLKQKEYRTKVIHALRRLGGNEVNVVVARIMAKILSDGLAELFSWNGRQKKRVFKSLMVARLMEKAIHSMCGPNSTNEKIKLSASRWLAQAKTRRIRRELRNDPRNNIDNESFSSDE
ncbi:hypothetical protein PV326_009695 [Microctonus aethiopoides]|nr:hypothetical protein PV326_009695 [Microctonus aethiopoides]